MKYALPIHLGCCLVLAAFAHADDQAEQTKTEEVKFLQRIATSVVADDPQVPAELNLKTEPKSWDFWDQGPVEGLREYAKTSQGVVWLGSSQGVARFDPNASHHWDRWQYFWGRRWLPDNDVQNIVVDNSVPHERVWIRTAEGVSRIDFVPMTFAKKAAHFEEIIEARHVRHGFVSESRLTHSGDLSSSQTNDNDNDGLWTAMYLGAEAYRYAVTGDPDARAKAERSLKALIRLETIDHVPGFFARSIRTRGEPSFGTRGGEWHRLANDDTEWKGDTSSDEQVGHYYAYSLYYDLVANEDEKKILREHVARLTDYMLANDDELLDIDGKPTLWGRYSRDYYKTSEGQYEKALRCTELLSYLKTTYHITGDKKYQDAYLERVHRGDAQATRDYRRWASEEWEINYSDDELYYLSIEPLLKYEEDPYLRDLYLDSLRFTWSQVLRERNALWNYISLARTGDCVSDSLRDDSRRTLERVPWDMVDWRAKNSHRRDVALRPNQDRHSRREMVHLLPPDERGVHKHNSSPFYVDDGGNGHSEETPTFWLLPYWMGRYHHFIQ